LGTGRLSGEDLLARAFQHQTDHLYGRLYFTHTSTLKREVMKRKIKKPQRDGEWE
jgi:peptide deformylase